MGSGIQLRLYEELNDFLPPERRKRRFAVEPAGISTVEELLASLGVPADQVELVFVNGDSVDFSHPVRDGDSVSAYPVFESLDIRPLLRVRSAPLRRIRFIAEGGLSRLARCLRALGFDAADAGSADREEIVRAAEDGGRVVLTADPRLAASPDLTRVYLVRSSTPRRQLKEVLSRFDLMDRSGHRPLRIIPARISR